MRLRVFWRPGRGIRSREILLSKEEMGDALEWFISQLVPDNLRRKLFVSLHYRDIHPGYSAEARPTRGKTHFRIDLATSLRRRSTQLKALAHEAVHIEQWATGKLLDVGPHYAVWKNRVVLETGPGGGAFIAYRNLPWEREARRLEKRLYVKYVAHTKESCDD